MSVENPPARVIRCPGCGGPSAYAQANPHNVKNQGEFGYGL